MNIIFIVICLIGMTLMLFIAPDKIVSTLLNGGENGVRFSLELLAIYSVWLSILKIIEKTKIDKKLQKILHPVIKRLFRGENEKTQSYIAINMSANFLGLGGAATPAGILAINEMDNKTGVATKNMVMLMVIASTSIQLLPTTIMSLMSTNGCDNPSSIILPTLISTAVSTISGIILVKVFVK